MNMSAA